MCNTRRETHRNDRENTRVNNPQPLGAIHPQLRIYNTLAYTLPQPQCPARMKAGLTPLENLLDHRLVTVAGHRPGVVALDDVLEAGAGHDNVVDHADAFAQGDKVEIVGEEV